MIRLFSSSLAVRIAALLLFALGSVAATTGVFWTHLAKSSDIPALIDDLGRQRMLSMQMVASAHDMGHDPTSARQHLQEAARHFDDTLENLNTYHEQSGSLSPRCEELREEAEHLWKDFHPNIDILLDADPDSEEYRQAQEQIIAQGPKLKDASDRIVQDIRRQAERSEQRMRWVMLAAVLFNIGLLVVGWLLSRRHIVYPLRHLERAAQKLQGGQFQTRVSQRHTGEIGRLEETFNDMAQELESLVGSLQQEREFAEAIVAHAPAGVAVHRDGEILFTNPKFFEMTGVGHVDEFCDDMVEIFFPEDHPRARAALCPDTDSPVVERLRLKAKTDGIRTVETVSVPIEYRGEATTLTVLRDITQRQELTARMMQMDRVMAIGTLVAGVGHEINNPLSYVIANLEYSLRDLKGKPDDAGLTSIDEDVLEALEESLEGAQRIRDIVKQLRSFTGNNDAPRDTIDVHKPLESAIRMAHSEIRHRARLEKHFTEVPPVKAQESKIAQVFLNLLVNAAHAIEAADGDENTITVEVFSRDDKVVVEIHDTGCGIADDAAERLFDPFFTTKAPGEGTGLGLPICQKIVESHDGVITFDTEVDRGTTFRVSLPAAEGESIPQTNQWSTDDMSNSRKIAVVDDEEMVGRFFKRAFRDQHHVDIITEPQRFLEALEDGQRYDIVFCDLMMPKITGMELYERIQNQYPTLAPRMVFITGGAVTSAARDFVATVDPPLLYKPFSLDKLRDIMADVEPYQG